MGFRELELVATLPGIAFYRAYGYQPTGDVEDIALTDGTRLPCQAMAKPLGPPTASS